MPPPETEPGERHGFRHALILESDDDSAEAGYDDPYGGRDLTGGSDDDDTVAADAGDDEIYLGYGDDLYGAENTGPDEGTDTIDGGDGEDGVTLSSAAQGRDPDHL